MPDRQVYLRSGSLNAIKGLVGVNFSCDVSDYLNYVELLTRAGDPYG